jgi:RimJ/RimL family protein N-acetyltransferase
MQMNSVDIQLLVVQIEHKIAIRSGKRSIQALLNVSIPDHWPQFPEAFDLSNQAFSAFELWPAYLFLCPSEAALVGNGGFTGPPNGHGEVEIGYEIAPSFQDRGFATAAVSEMLKYAFSHHDVQAVVAHTLAQTNASNAVLKKVGMTLVADIPNPELGSVWRWQLSRPQ